MRICFPRARMWRRWSARRYSRTVLFTEHSTPNRRRHHRLGARVDRSVYRAFRRIVAISEGVEQALLGGVSGASGKDRCDIEWLRAFF